MSLSISNPAVESSSNVSNHASRAWYRPIKLPLEDKSLHLCARHRLMDLKRSDFAARPQEDTLPPDWHFGKFSEVIQRSDYCNFCKMIVDSVSTKAHKHDMDVLGCWIPDVTYTAEDAGTGVKTEMITLRLRILPETTEFEEVFKPFDVIPLARENEEGLFLGRKMIPKGLDIPLMKTWLRRCEEWHTIVCWKEDLSRSRREGPVTIKFPLRPFIRLLDLKDNCLVETSATPVFVALSYVWGHVKMFKTLKKTLPDMMQPGSLLKNFDLFPTTIRDVITLTRQLEHRYLWIDSISILQDDDLDKAAQVQHMDAIFTRASLVIIAAGGGDANAGLTGLNGGLRNTTQHTATYSDELTLLSLRLGSEDDLNASVWNSRCWTYQEYVLSRRSLVFTQDSMYFQCGHVCWSEDINMLWPELYRNVSNLIIVPSRGEEPPTVTTEITFSLGVAHHYYFIMINEYTMRHMTYSTDRLSGFQGILNFYNMNYGPVFIWGMWSGEMLVHSLIWQPQQDLARVPIDEETNAPIYPSWSWAGWSGPVIYCDYLDWNGLPALSGPWKKRALQSEYGETIDIKKDSTSSDGTIVSMYHLQLHTRIGSFRLTLDDRSGTSKPKSTSKTRGEDIIRFGITTVHPADLGTEEEWLGTILLPASYQENLSDEHEFVVLSSAYCFVSDELRLDASSALEPYAAINVMLITRQGTTANDDKPVVVRAGVEDGLGYDRSTLGRYVGCLTRYVMALLEFNDRCME